LPPTRSRIPSLCNQGKADACVGITATACEWASGVSDALPPASPRTSPLVNTRAVRVVNANQWAVIVDVVAVDPWTVIRSPVVAAPVHLSHWSLDGPSSEQARAIGRRRRSLTKSDKNRRCEGSHRDYPTHDQPQHSSCPLHDPRSIGDPLWHGKLSVPAWDVFDVCSVALLRSKLNR
jgi:hypothetical protein